MRPRFRLRDVLPLLLVLAWGFAALGLLAYALGAPHREAWLGALSALAALALSWWVWRPGPRPWGALPLVVLSVVPLLYAVWWGSPWSPFVALPAVLLLALQPATRKPLLAPGRPRLAAVLVASYLALAPPLDALAFGPPEPPVAQVEADGFTLGESSRQRLGTGGAVWEQTLSREGSPNLSLLRLTLDAGEDLPQALRDRYAPGQDEQVSFWPFPFGFTAHERAAEAAALPGEWDRVAVVHRETFLFFLFPIPVSEGERQVVLLRPVQAEARPSLLPPFAVAWQGYAGYRVHEAGDNAGALRLLDGKVHVGAQALDLPADAYTDLDVGPLRTPAPALLALAALALGARAMPRRKP